MARFWQEIDVFVLPSISTPTSVEQFGRVLVEAMAAGVPVIGSSSGAIPEVIDNAGLIFPEGDVNALAANLVQLRDEPALTRELIAKGQERIDRVYSYAAVANRLVTVYNALLKGI